MTTVDSGWLAKVVDVMNPMGVLVAEPIRSSSWVAVHGSMRDALFLCAWKKAIQPKTQVSLGFNPKAALQLGLNNMLQLALKVVGEPETRGSDSLIGSARGASRFSNAGPAASSVTNDEMQLKEEVLYLFGIMAALGSSRTLTEKQQTFEYLSAVVGQKDELLGRAVGEHLGSSLRSVFDYLCSLHYFQSNIRQSTRFARLTEIEHEIQAYCEKIPEIPWNLQQNGALVFESPQTGGLASNHSAVVFLPSAYSFSECANLDVVSGRIWRHLQAGQKQFYFADSFHLRLRWMERLCESRQIARLEALRADPLRLQSVLESRSGRHRITILSTPTLNFLDSLSKSKLFSTLSIPMQEVIQTALELDVVRRKDQWGDPPCFDFVNLVESVAVQSYRLISNGVLSTMTDNAVRKFLDAVLLRQEIDGEQCYRMLSD